MAILASDILFFNSGGAANANPNLSLGGVISTTQLVTNVTANLFDSVSGAEAAAGDVNYRGFYVKNAHATLTLQLPFLWLTQLTNSADDEFDLAIAAEAVNVTMATIANEATAPATVVFTRPTTKAAGIAVTSIPAGQARGIWIKRTVGAAAAAITGDNGILRVEGDTAA